MREELLLSVSHRQVVFNIPKMLRLFFRFKRKLLDSLCLLAVRSLVKFLHTATGLEMMPGVVAVIQTFGDRINFHPHIHVLMAEGGTAPDGVFHHVSRFRDEVILGWPHTGFNVHSQVRAHTKIEAERVGKYMIWPLLSLKRLFFDETEGKVRYKHSSTSIDLSHPRGL